MRATQVPFLSDGPLLYVAFHHLLFDRLPSSFLDAFIYFPFLSPYIHLVVVCLNLGISFQKFEANKAREKKV